jgi:hypothetical protein
MASENDGFSWIRHCRKKIEKTKIININFLRKEIHNDRKIDIGY